MEGLQKSIKTMTTAVSSLSLNLQRVNEQLENLMKEKADSANKKEEEKFIIPETECWDDDDEPPFPLSFGLDAQDLKREIHTTDVSKVSETASSVLETDGLGAPTTSTQLVVPEATQGSRDDSLSITPTSVESASKTADETARSNDDSSVVSDSDKFEPSEPVQVTSHNVTDQLETVTQSVPVDQLETPMKFESFKSDEKTLKLETSEGQQQQQQQQEKEVKEKGNITGEEVLKVIKSLPEQPNGLHGTELSDLSSKEQEGSPDVLDKPKETIVDAKKETDMKAEEEGLTFNEWTQKVLEAEKDKKESNEESSGQTKVPPSKQRKKKNHASHDCGAKVLASNPESTNPKGILNSNKDDYMINPCKVKKWVIIELCEPIQAHSVEIASLELFSSPPKMVRIFLSDRYPTKDWKLAGEKTLTEKRIIQPFDLSESHDYFAKYVKVELVDHFGDEHFCPLTIFRVFGIAVTDYDDISHDDPESETLDDDHIIGGDLEESSKNLFDSARDTVMTLVKKVLNVDPEGEAEQNKTESTDTTTGDESAEGSTTDTLNDTLPCPPNASIPVEKNDTDDEGKKSEGQDQGQGQAMPPVPEPGKTNSVSIVTKLEDDEQVETSLTESDQTLQSNGTTLQDFMTCEAGNKAQKYKLKNKCKPVSKLCQFTRLILKNSSQMSFDYESRALSVNEKNKLDDIDLDVNEDLSQSEKSQLGSIDVTLSEQSFESKTQDQSAEVTQTIGMTQSAGKDSTSVYRSITTTEMVQYGETLEKSAESKQVESEIKQKPSSKSCLGHTSVMEATIQTDSFEQSLSESKTGLEFSKTETNIMESHVTETLDTVYIDPSPTAAAIQSDMTGTSLGQEPTPSLPDSWKPDTDDVLETGTQSVTDSMTQKVDMSEKSPDLTQSDGSDLVPASDGDKSSIMSASTIFESPTESIAEFSSSSTDSSVSNLQPTMTSLDMASSHTPTVDVPKVTDLDAGVKVTPDVAMEKQEGQKNGVKVESGSEKDILKVNHTGAVEKTGDQKVKTEKNLDLKVPMLSGSNRESAIMRLSNRLKVLEQNVSLSSRFLEELSKRYKKQSEDMMKLLNKTLAKLSNMTVETEVKNKIHEEEMYAMERRLENLTLKVSHLTNSLQTLNKQVTDRQMIATSMEIIIIVIILLVASRRIRKDSLSPEVRKLIQLMPEKPSQPFKKQRRNSISGPVTPSKKLSSDIDPGGSLNKFPSETCLDLGIVLPSQSLFGNQKGIDGVKKKKRKKQRLLDGKGNWTGLEISSVGQSIAEVSSKHSGTSLNAHTDFTDKLTFPPPRKKTEYTGNWSIGGAISKKPPLPNGRKKDDESSGGSPNTGRRDKNFQRGHRRQKSLPKQHFTDEEFHAQAIKNGHSNVHNGKFYCNEPVEHIASKKQDLIQQSHKLDLDDKSRKKHAHKRLSDSSVTDLEHKTSFGKGRKGPSDKQPLTNGFDDKAIDSHHHLSRVKPGKFGDSYQSDDISVVGERARPVEIFGSVQESTLGVNGFHNYENDDVFMGGTFQETSPYFLLKETSQSCAIKGGNSLNINDKRADNQQVKEDENLGIKGDANMNLNNKGFRKLWDLFK